MKKIMKKNHSTACSFCRNQYSGYRYLTIHGKTAVISFITGHDDHFHFSHSFHTGKKLLQAAFQSGFFCTLCLDGFICFPGYRKSRHQKKNSQKQQDSPLLPPHCQNPGSDTGFLPVRRFFRVHFLPPPSGLL